jgi:osmotically-inducible protein OsmY
MSTSSTTPDIRAKVARRLVSIVRGELFVAATRDGHVRLEGRVHSLDDHRRALAAAWSTAGVTLVEDRIEIVL